MIVTTTPYIEGKKVSQYLGIVTGEAIMGANILKDIFASIIDVIGGRAAAYEKELSRAQKIAPEEREERAQQMGADAVVGVDLDYETLKEGSMLMVTVSGTAVKIGS